MTTGTRLDFIPAQFVKVATAYRLDLTQYIVGGVHIVGSNGVVRLWKVNLADFSNAGEITFVNAIGKDDSVDFEITSDGSILITMSEAAPGGGGATAQPVVYRIAGVFPAYQTVDKDARWQANAATNMANAAQRTADAANLKVDALTVRVDVIDIRLRELEQGSPTL